MDTSALGNWLGLAGAVTVLLISVIRRQGFDYADIGTVGTTFLGCYNLPPPFILMAYGFQESLWKTLPKELIEHHKYLVFAVLCAFLTVLVSVSSMLVRAWKIKPEPKA